MTFLDLDDESVVEAMRHMLPDASMKSMIA